jgi:hypothetical protein
MLSKSASGVHERAVPYSARREPQRLNVPPGKSCSGSSGWVGEKEYAPTKTLPAHRLAGAHKRGALSSSRRAPHYSSRRGLRCGLARGVAHLGAPGWAGEISSLFEHPVGSRPFRRAVR